MRGEKLIIPAGIPAFPTYNTQRKLTQTVHRFAQDEKSVLLKASQFPTFRCWLNSFSCALKLPRDNWDCLRHSTLVARRERLRGIVTFFWLARRSRLPHPS